ADAPAWLTQALAFAVIFLIIYALLLTITLLLERGVRVARMQWLNRILGAGLGAGKAGLLLGFLFLGMTAYLPDLGPDALERSNLARFLSAGAQKLVEAIPEEYRDNLRAQLQQLEALQPLATP